MKSSGLGWAPNPKAGIVIRTCEDTEGEEGQMTKEVVWINVAMSQATPRIAGNY